MKAYRVLVVDDEAIVREAIKSSIHWEQYQIEIGACVANAPDAIAWLEHEHADLVITDIRMPVIDGLALVEILRAKYPEMEFLIISGYADFEYARQAMRFGVRDYLLKPVDTNTLVNAVCKARDEWEMQHDRMHDRQIPVSRQFSPTVARLLGILDEEIANEELSLKWISHQKMFLNENYLGKLFQKETGQRFTAYMYEQRMLLAKRLISNNPDILVQEIARKTGYGDNAQYFSIAFKKYTGLSPSDYRKKLLASSFDS
jgi:YesN/AraC family two-component response regulator